MLVDELAFHSEETMKRYLSTLALLIASTSALAIEVPSIEVRGRMISVGQTADTLFSILQPTDIDRQKVESDYMHPGGPQGDQVCQR